MVKKVELDGIALRDKPIDPVEDLLEHAQEAMEKEKGNIYIYK